MNKIIPILLMLLLLTGCATHSIESITATHYSDGIKPCQIDEHHWGDWMRMEAGGIFSGPTYSVTCDKCLTTFKTCDDYEFKRLLHGEKLSVLEAEQSHKKKVRFGLFVVAPVGTYYLLPLAL